MGIISNAFGTALVILTFCAVKRSVDRDEKYIHVRLLLS